MKLAPLVLVVLTLAASAPARADIAIVDSLAALVDLSPFVVEATVTDAKQQNGREYLLTLEVHESLKGPRGERLVLAASDDRLLGMRGLIFATAPRPISTADCYGVPHTMSYVGRALVGDPNRWTLPSRDFGVFAGRDDITAAIRARAATPGVHRTVAVAVPGGTPLAALYVHSLGGVVVRVPADDELERWLVDAIDAGDPDRRVQAVLLLEPFESVPNIERLLALLDDPSSAAAARETLRRWEVPLPPK